MAKYKKINDFEKHSKNPFIEKAMESITPIRKTQIIRPSNSKEIQLIVNQNSGETTGHSAFLRYIEVDEEKFAKVYLSQLSVLFDLSSTSIRVFAYVLNQLKANQDSFIFSMKRCQEFTKYKAKKSVLEGLTCLIDNGIIARSEDDFLYFINPLVVFNGSRVTFARTYVKKRVGNPNQTLLELDEKI